MYGEVYHYEKPRLPMALPCVPVLDGPGTLCLPAHSSPVGSTSHLCTMHRNVLGKVAAGVSKLNHCEQTHEYTKKVDLKHAYCVGPVSIQG